MDFTRLLVLTVLATACTSQAHSDLEVARARWDASPHAYSVTWQQACACSENQARPIRIAASTSADPDAITSAIYADDRTPVDPDVSANLLTVDGLFDKIQGAIDTGAHRIDVSYDATLGFPVDVFIDQHNIPDTYFSLTLSDFSEP